MSMPPEAPAADEAAPQPNAKRIIGSEFAAALIAAGVLFFANGLPGTGTDWARNLVSAIAGGLAAGGTIYWMRRRRANKVEHDVAA